MRLIVVAILIASCGDDVAVRPDAAVDLGAGVTPDLNCYYGDVSRQTCTQPNAVMQGTCFESPDCLCVFPEATWVCCYAGYGGLDGPGLRVGDPCCGRYVAVGQPGYPCYCDGTHHWACPVDLGATHD